MEKLFEWTLGIGVAVIGWLVKCKFATDKEIADIKTDAATRAQEIEDHKQIDTERFGRIEAMFAEHRSQFIDILKALNGRVRS